MPPKRSFLLFMITLQQRVSLYLALLCLFSVNGDAQPVDSLLARGEALSPLNSLIISWKGEVIGERYYRGMRSNRVVNVKSVSKSLISPLVGIAIRDSLLEGAHQKLTSLLPEYAQYIEESHRDEILLHHVLSMTTGLEGTSFQNYGPWVSSSDWVRFAVSQPSVCPPASCMTYSTGNSHLVSVILSRASGKDLRTYARDVFFRPLGISLPSRARRSCR